MYSVALPEMAIGIAERLALSSVVASLWQTAMSRAARGRSVTKIGVRTVQMYSYPA